VFPERATREPRNKGDRGRIEVDHGISQIGDDNPVLEMLENLLAGDRREVEETDFDSF